MARWPATDGFSKPTRYLSTATTSITATIATTSHSRRESYNSASIEAITLVVNMTQPRDATVLIADDEPEVTDAYALRLRQKYEDVRTAYGGEEALDVTDDDIDVVLLDRRMPFSGDKVLREIRERGYDCRVIMVTAANPDFDIVDMPFDDYLCKPIDRDDLFAAIDQQVKAAAFDNPVSELFSLTAKLAVLEAEHTAEQLEESSEYRRMGRRAAELRDGLDVSRENFEEMLETFTDINRGRG